MWCPLQRLPAAGDLPEGLQGPLDVLSIHVLVGHAPRRGPWPRAWPPWAASAYPIADRPRRAWSCRLPRGGPQALGRSAAPLAVRVFVGQPAEGVLRLPRATLDGVDVAQPEQGL